MEKVDFLELVKSGRKEWNNWRETNPHIIPDLREAMRPYDFNLSGYDLSGFNFSRMDFQNLRSNIKPLNIFIETDFTDSNFFEANISNSVFRYCNFTRAYFLKAQLIHTFFIDQTLLKWTNFSSCHFGETHFERSQMSWAMFSNTDLGKAIGLDQISHLSPSFIDFACGFKHSGDIPFRFLKNVQLNDEALGFFQKIASYDHADYGRTFFSYSRRDGVFTNKLYNDLMEAGVHCWLDHENLRAGVDYRKSIIENIREYDKFLIIISKNSANSEYVASEVEEALRLLSNNKTFIVPIDLDDSIHKTDCNWITEIKDRSINIISFSKKGDTYYNHKSKLLKSLMLSEK